MADHLAHVAAYGGSVSATPGATGTVKITIVNAGGATIFDGELAQADYKQLLTDAAALA